MPRQVTICSFVVSFLLISGLSTSVVAQTPANRVAAGIDENKVTTLLGNVHPMARAEFDRGAVSAETLLDHMVFQLRPSPAQQAALDDLVETQQDPQSALFHHWLTPAEYGARFGASLQDLARISIWLTQHGFVVEEIPAGNRLVIFSGNAGQVEDTFHTQIHRYVVEGVSHVANTQDPQVPSALAGVVGGIVSLNDFRLEPQIRSRIALGADPHYSNGSTHYLFPADWATIYNVNPLYKAGTTGAGGSIAIAGRSNINLADVSQFRASSRLQANNPSVILVNTNPGLVAGDQDESTLDVEWSGAVAPAATLKFVVAASTATTDGIDLAAQYIVNHATAQVMSTSYGSCEQDMGTTELAFYNSLWQQAASEGISSFVSSGDAGAAGCYSGSSTSASGTGVNGLCSSPYSTCVGGTEFHEGSNTSYWSSTNGVGDSSALSYIQEEVWNESGTNGGSGLWASGGGASLHYNQPSWQKGLSGIGVADGMRAVPDVAMSASGHDGYILVENGSYYVISGTSAASPSFAGVMALVVQAKGGIGQGNANPSLYALSNASRSPFHTTPSGNNSVPGQTGFTASGAQYNLATGLGSVDAAALAGAWGGGGGSKTTIDFGLAASAGGATVLAGKTTSFTLRVTESGAGSNKVSLTATAPSGVSGSISPSSILPGTTSTVTVTATSGMAAGVSNIVITGSDSTGTQSVTYALTVTPSPTLVLNAGSTSISVMRGGSTTAGFNTVVGGAFTGVISYSVSGLPAGVTAKWSANPQTPPASASSNSETLTLTASAGAAVSSAALMVTAAGDGLSQYKSLTLQVQPAVGAVLTVSPQTISMPSTSTVTATITFTPVGGVVAAAGGKGSSLSMSGLPKGMIASWSSPGVSSTEAVVWKLTLTGSAKASASASALSLSAAFAAKNGSVYGSTINVPLTVTLSAARRLAPRPIRVHGKS